MLLRVGENRVRSDRASKPFLVARRPEPRRLRRHDQLTPLFARAALMRLCDRKLGEDTLGFVVVFLRRQRPFQSGH